MKGQAAAKVPTWDGHEHGADCHLQPSLNVKPLPSVSHTHAGITSADATDIYSCNARAVTAVATAFTAAATAYTLFTAAATAFTAAATAFTAEAAAFTACTAALSTDIHSTAWTCSASAADPRTCSTAKYAATATLAGDAAAAGNSSTAFHTVTADSTATAAAAATTDNTNSH